MRCLAVLLWVACAEAPLPAAAPPPAASPVSIDEVIAVSGQTTTVTVRGTWYGEPVALLGAARVGRSCPAWMQGLCADLAAPQVIDQRLATGLRTSMTVTWPETAVGVDLHLQAVAGRGDGLRPALSAVRTIQVLPGDRDEDGDGVSNREEVTLGTDLYRRDTDGDGLQDDERARYGSDPARADTDGDGLNDGEEVARGTHVRDADTDADGSPDHAEVRAGTDPLDPDTDDDGFSDQEEGSSSTDPLDPDDPVPQDADTGGDTAAGIEASCPPGEVRNCWASCAPRADLGDGTCDRWLMCPRYGAELEDCAAAPDPAPFCPEGTALSCAWSCEPLDRHGDGACDEIFSCPMRDWDRGDCPLGQGTTLRAWVRVASAEDVERLRGVSHIDGTLEVAFGAPDVLVLPDLVSVRELVVHGSADIVSLELPALQLVEGSATLGWPARPGDRLERFEAPRLERVGRQLRLASASLGAASLDGLRSLGDLTVQRTMGAAPLDLSLPALTEVRGQLWLELTGGSLNLPALERVGSLLTRQIVGDLRLPALTTAATIDVEADGAVVVPRLLTAAITLRGASSADFDRVVDTPWLTTLDVGAVHLPSVVTIGGLRAWQTAEIVAPALATVGAVRLDEAQLVLGRPVVALDVVVLSSGDVALPMLTTARDLDVRAAGAVDLPQLSYADAVDIAADGVSLPALERVQGGARLDVRGVLHLPALSRVDTLSLEHGAGADLPLLAQARSVSVRGCGTTSLPSLGGVGARPEGWTVYDRDGLDLGATTGCARASFVAPALSWAGRVSIDGADASLGALEEVGQLTWSCADCVPTLPALRRVWALSTSPGVDLPALELAWDVTITSAGGAPIDLPRLTDVTWLTLHGGATRPARLRLDALTRSGASAMWPFEGPEPYDGHSPGIRVDGDGDLGVLSLPSLLAAPAITVTGNALAGLRAPRLQSAGTIFIGELPERDWMSATAAGLRTTPSTTTFELDLSALQEVESLFLLHDRRHREVRLPALQHVGYRLRLHDLPNLTTVALPAYAEETHGAWLNLVHLPALTALELPAARALGRLALVDTGLTRLDLPGLEHLHDHLTAYDNRWLEALRVPNLRSTAQVYLADNAALADLGLDGLEEAGAVWVTGQAALERLSLPSLFTIGGALDVRDNPALVELSAPALGSVGVVSVTGNPLLARCELGGVVCGL